MNSFSCSFVSWSNSAELLILPPRRLFVPPVAIPLLWFPTDYGGGFVCLIRLRLFISRLFVMSVLCMSDCRYSIGSRVILTFHLRRRRHQQLSHSLSPAGMGFNHCHSFFHFSSFYPWIHQSNRFSIQFAHPSFLPTVNSMFSFKRHDRLDISGSVRLSRYLGPSSMEL